MKTEKEVEERLKQCILAREKLKAIHEDEGAFFVASAMMDALNWVLEKPTSYSKNSEGGRGKMLSEARTDEAELLEKKFNQEREETRLKVIEQMGIEQRMIASQILDRLNGFIESGRKRGITESVLEPLMHFYFETAKKYNIDLKGE